MGITAMAGGAPNPMARYGFMLAMFLLAVVAAAVRDSSTLAATTITVTTTADSLAADGLCSLREAVIAANTDTSQDACPRGTAPELIELPAGTYTLALAGQGEHHAASGDLDLRGNLTIRGAGPGLTVIDAAGLDRVFHMIGGPIRLERLTIRGGIDPEEVGGAGVLQCAANHTLTLDNVIVEDNVSGATGGGVFVCQGTDDGLALDIRDSTFRRNRATFGGAVGLSSLTIAAISGSSFTDNTAVVFGGAISGNGHLTITSSAFTANVATAGAGGALRHGFGNLDVTNTTFSGNWTNGGGGALDLSGSSVTTLTHVTITANTADADQDGEPADLPADGGGILNRSDRPLVLLNTILAGNTRAGGSPDCAGSFTSFGGNLLGDVAGCSGAGAGDVIGPPNLAPLERGVHALCLGSGSPGSACTGRSPAIDFAACASGVDGDQRRQPRPSGDACDAGAYESAGAPGAAGPVLTFTLETAGGRAYEGGWTREFVRLRWSCMVADGRTVAGQPADANYETTGTHTTPAAQTCEDSEGATSTPVSVSPTTVRIDRTPPALTFSFGSYVSPSWTSAPVTIDWSCDDAHSGPSSAPEDTRLATGGAHDLPAATCIDAAGNESEPSDPPPANIDLTKPVLSYTLTLEPGGAGYASPEAVAGPVALRWTCTDSGGSGVDTATVPGDTSFAAPGDHDRAAATCADLAGNVSNSADPPPVVIAGPADVEAPVLEFSLAFENGEPYSSPAWAAGPVWLRWTCVDEPGGSGVDATTIPADHLFDTDGAHDPAPTTCADNAGNASLAVDPPLVRIDRHAPVVAVTVERANALPGSAAAEPLDLDRWYNHRLRIRIACGDAGSGVARNSLPAELLSSWGVRRFSPPGECVDHLGRGATPPSGWLKVDTRKPTCAIAVSARPRPGESRWVTLTVRASDVGSGVASAEIVAITPAPRWGPALPAPSGSSWELLGGRGAYWEVSARVRDHAGNERWCTRQVRVRS
ncbi:MAG: choice-of-anchor Q domain-containing protein [Dehalococcoidia bacterium]